jgi:nucleotide-binding universal stress UspA family protein
MTSHSTSLRLVCVTDFSEPGGNAVTVAAALARRGGFTLVLVHALDLGPGFLVAERQRRVSVRVGEARLLEEARRVGTDGLAVETVLLREGWAAASLLDFIKAAPPAFVVVSSRRKSGLDRWAVGSISDELAQNAPCPTLVVRHTAPFLAWARGEAPLKVMAALDFGACTESVLRWVGQWRSLGPCELTVCHVNWKQDERELDGAKVLAPIARNATRIQATLERNLRKHVRDTIGVEDFTTVVKPTWGAPDPEIIETAEAAGADLLVTGTHQRHGIGWLWHGSVSRNLMHHAPMSVASVPAVVVADPRQKHVPQFRRVLVTTDFSSLGDVAVPWACAVLPPGGVLELLHVVAPGAAKRKGARPGVDPRERLRDLVPEEAARLGIRPEFHVVEHRDAAEAICREAERFGADAICLASHGRGGISKALLGSVAASVMARSRRPVIVVRPGQ